MISVQKRERKGEWEGIDERGKGGRESSHRFIRLFLLAPLAFLITTGSAYMDPDVRSGNPDDQKSSGRPIEVKRTGPDGCHPPEVTIIVPQKPIGDEAVVVWDAALVLAHFLEKHQDHLKLHRQGVRKHVIDVGAGTGAVGLTASALG